MQRIHLCPVIFLVVCLQWACAADEKPRKVDIRGAITKLNASDAEAKKKGTLGSILVEGKIEKDTNQDKASVRITDKTKIEILSGKERKPAKFDDLKQGAKVEVTFDGPVAESYPVQGTAGSVTILELPK